MVNCYRNPLVTKHHPIRNGIGFQFPNLHLGIRIGSVLIHSCSHGNFGLVFDAYFGCWLSAYTDVSHFKISK